MLSHGGDPAFRGDAGAADPRAAAVLASFAAGDGSEHAALTALADGRLLVPVVARLAGLDTAAGGEGAAPVRAKTSEMAMPVLVGLDGRPAIPAFTCLDAVRRWQPAARPVPVAAARVWQAAAADSCAVVIDVAGPVPLAVEGARLAALARGDAVPAPYLDPDVRSAVAAAVAGQPAVRRFELAAGQADTDLTVILILAPGSPPGAGPAAGADGPGAGADGPGVGAGGPGAAAAALGSQAAAGIMAALGPRLRRGIAVTIGRP